MFDQPNFWEKKSKFFYEKDGRLQSKKADIKILVKPEGEKVETLAEVTINLCNYLGRGQYIEKYQMTGKVYFVNFEILLEGGDDDISTRESWNPQS